MRSLGEHSNVKEDGFFYLEIREVKRKGQFDCRTKKLSFIKSYWIIVFLKVCSWSYYLHP
jgi:hypothetical protein